MVTTAPLFENQKTQKLKKIGLRSTELEAMPG
jgi:hypothetical protein